MARVAVEHLAKVYPGPAGRVIHALRDVSFETGDGELLVLLGPSATGKTTTLRLIAGLESPSSGTVLINGQVVNQLPPKDRDVAMVFQSPALYPHMTVSENLAFGLKLRGVGRAERAGRVRTAAERLGLGDCLERLPAALSGGQRQRVALGRALVRQPKIFLLDEPLSNLDPPLRLELRREISALTRSSGAATVYVTHDQAEALALGDRIAVLHDGVIQQFASPMDLYQHPANLFVAGFIGSPPMNLLKATLRRSAGKLCLALGGAEAGPDREEPKWSLEVHAGGRDLSEWVDKPIVLGLRPEHTRLAEGADPRPGAQTIEALVEAIEPAGADTWLHAKARDQRLTARVPDGATARPAEKVRLLCELGRACFFDPATGRAIPCAR